MEMTFYNPSGSMTFSADGITYGYIGRASATGITQPGTSTVDSRNGYSTYSIYWPGDILVVLPVKANGNTCLLGVSQSNGMWTIQVHKSNGSVNSLGLDVQEYTEVYVFGAPYPGVNSNFMLYDANGNPSGDLSRLPLTVQAILSIDGNPANTDWQSSVAMSAPGIIGAPLGYRTTSTKGGNGFWTNRKYGYGWVLNSSTSIGRNLVGLEYSQDDGGIPVVNTTQAVQAIITSVAGL